MSQLKEDQQSQIEQLQELKKKVHISSNRLLELTYSDNKYMAKLLNYNAQASKLIAADYIQEALVYLLEAEKMLEYGASCGKIIDRNIIITILHNQACCYYKDSDLHAAAKYIEGVIFNLKTNLDSLQSSPATSGVIDSEKGRKNNEFIYATIQKKIQLIQYYLKFCTINSQAKKRQIALQAGSKVKSVCANFFQDMISDNPKIHACDQNNKEAEIMDLKLLLKNLRIFKQQIAISQLQNYIKCTRYYIKKWNENKVIKKIHFALQKHVNNYSISEVIDMIPMQYHQDDSLRNAQNLNTKVIMRQILHFSMGYFTVSTQYRLIAESLYKNQQQKQKSQQFIKSNINHLLAILFLAFNLNCDLLFMKQIISSYQHHFKISLSLSDNNQDDQIQEQCCALLFNVAKPKPKINHQALIQKITKLKIKEKEVKKKIHTQYQDSYTYDHQVGIKTNQSKVTTKTKRSVSKKQTNGISSSKNLHKTVNQTIMEDSKLLNRSKDRSISKGKQSLCGVKKRSKSKDVFNLSKQLKLSRDPIKIQEKHTKKGHDEYQLCNTKLHSKKRVNSVSSDRSVSFHNRKESKSKLPTQSQKMKDKKMPKKRTQTKVQTINKKKKSKKQSSTNKNYYL